MKTETVSVARIYLSEGDHRLNRLLDLLHDREHVRGVTVYRGIAGFGDSGRVHLATWVDLSVDMPIVVEFFDAPERVDTVLEDLRAELEPRHVVTWRAEVNID